MVKYRKRTVPLLHNVEIIVYYITLMHTVVVVVVVVKMSISYVALSQCCSRTTVQCQRNQFEATSTW